MPIHHCFSKARGTFLAKPRRRTARHSPPDEAQKKSVFTDVSVGTNDLNNARRFYDSLLGELGQKRIADLGDNGSIWGENAPSFFVLKPANGAPVSVGNGMTISFEAPPRAAIDAFHAAALAAGGTCECLRCLCP
jgi:catechol 2,3-dioxygenase-like lactoylglutathione lyase family enzyme